MLLFLTYTVLSQAVLLQLRFIHNSVFFPLPTPPTPPPHLCSAWNLCLARSIIPYAHYIFSTTRTYIKQIIILFLYIYICIFQSFILWYYPRSHSSIRFLGCETTVLLPNKSSGSEVQPLATLYPKVRLSPWRTGPEKYPLQGVDPRSHLICTPPRRATPPCSP